jgi:hypothetical protein
MDANTKRKAIAYWEKRRIVYNVLLVPASLLAWQISKEFTYHIDDQTPARLTDPAVMLALVVLCVSANICYSFVYVLEFFFLADEPRKFWPAPGRTVFLVIGCLLGMWLASVTMSQLQINFAGPILPYDP